MKTLVEKGAVGSVERHNRFTPGRRSKRFEVVRGERLGGENQERDLMLPRQTVNEMENPLRSAAVLWPRELSTDDENPHPQWPVGADSPRRSFRRFAFATDGCSNPSRRLRANFFSDLVNMSKVSGLDPHLNLCRGWLLVPRRPNYRHKETSLQTSMLAGRAAPSSTTSFPA
jgi:hypothetical protein